MSALAARSQDPAAAEATRQLFEKHRQRIFAYCLGQLGNRCDAEDAVQTTFLYAFSCLERGVTPEAELAWLFKIALNVCRTRRRTLGRRRRIEAPTDFDTCEYALAGPERGENELLGLSSALAAMPPNQRNALLLREWQGLTYAEIAEKLTLSQSAVETLLFRARRTLATQLSHVPQRVAVMLNVPVILRLARRLLSNAGALKTTAAVVAVGAATAVGGQELAHVDNPGAPARAHLTRYAPAPRLSTSVSPRRDSTAPISPRVGTSRPVRAAAPSTAEAAVTVPGDHSSPAASASSSAPRATAPAAAAPAASEPAAGPIAVDISPPAAPAPPVELPATPAGELTGSVVDAATAAVQAVVPPVVHVQVPDLPNLIPAP